MARDIERQRRRFKEHNKDRSRKLVDLESSKHLFLPAQVTLNKQPLESTQYASCAPSIQGRSRIADEPVKNPPGTTPHHTQTQKILCDVNNVAEEMSQKTMTRRPRNKLVAAQGLVAAMKKGREGSKIINDQTTQSTSDNSSSTPSSRSTDSKSTSTASTISTVILTPKRAAMIDAVKRSRQDRVYLSSDRIDNMQPLHSRRVVNIQPEETTHARPEQFEKPRKVNSISPRKGLNFRTENVLNLRQKQVINSKKNTPPSRYVRICPPSPLRHRLAVAKANGKPKKSTVAPRLALTKSASVSYSQKPKSSKKVLSDRNVHKPKELTRSQSHDMTDDHDDVSVEPLIWKSPSWQKQQGRIQERLSRRFPVKMAT